VPRSLRRPSRLTIGFFSEAGRGARPITGSRGVDEPAGDERNVDGRTIIVPLMYLPRSWHATPEECARFEVFGDGAHIHRPDVDEDLTVAGLLAGKRFGASARSFRAWPESRHGERDGSVAGSGAKA
jgi:hypothetical protein